MFDIIKKFRLCDKVTEKVVFLGYNKDTVKEKEITNMSVMKVNKNNFEQVKNSEKTVLLDFYADWCGPCRMVSPIVDQIAEENSQYLVAKVNVDEEPELAQRFGIVTIPTLIVLKNGAIAARADRAIPKEAILEMLNA